MPSTKSTSKTRSSSTKAKLSSKGKTAGTNRPAAKNPDNESPTTIESPSGQEVTKEHVGAPIDPVPTASGAVVASNENLGKEAIVIDKLASAADKRQSPPPATTLIDQRADAADRQASQPVTPDAAPRSTKEYQHQRVVNAARTILEADEGASVSVGDLVLAKDELKAALGELDAE